MLSMTVSLPSKVTTHNLEEFKGAISLVQILVKIVQEGKLWPGFTQTSAFFVIVPNYDVRWFNTCYINNTYTCM